MTPPDPPGLGDLCVWRGVIHSIGAWEVIPGVTMPGERSRNEDGEEFPVEPRRCPDETGLRSGRGHVTLPG